MQPHHQDWNYTYCFPFAFAALNFAQRSFVAFEILALAAADITRFVLPVVLPVVLPLLLPAVLPLLLPVALALLPVPPKSLIAARTLSNCCCAALTSFSHFASSCFNAAKISMRPPGDILSQESVNMNFPSVLQRLVEEANLLAERLNAFVGLQISIRESADVTILDLRGRSTIDGGESELLSSRLKELVASGVRKVLLNLVDLIQVDSSGVVVIVETYLSLKRQRGELKLLCACGQC